MNTGTQKGKNAGIYSDGNMEMQADRRCDAWERKDILMRCLKKI